MIEFDSETQGAGNISALSLQASPRVPQERRLWKESQEKRGERGNFVRTLKIIEA